LGGLHRAPAAFGPSVVTVLDVPRLRAIPAKFDHGGYSYTHNPKYSQDMRCYDVDTQINGKYVHVSAEADSEGNFSNAHVSVNDQQGWDRFHVYANTSYTQVKQLRMPERELRAVLAWYTKPTADTIKRVLGSFVDYVYRMDAPAEDRGVQQQQQRPVTNVQSPQAAPPPVTLPDGTLYYADRGCRVLHDGTFLYDNGARTNQANQAFSGVVLPDNSIRFTDGARLLPWDGTFYYANQVIAHPDGSREYPDGMGLDPQGQFVQFTSDAEDGADDGQNDGDAWYADSEQRISVSGDNLMVRTDSQTTMIAKIENGAAKFNVPIQLYNYSIPADTPIEYDPQGYYRLG
jgi:hypothetical protein